MIFPSPIWENEKRYHFKEKIAIAGRLPDRSPCYHPCGLLPVIQITGWVIDFTPLVIQYRSTFGSRRVGWA